MTTAGDRTKDPTAGSPARGLVDWIVRRGWLAWGVVILVVSVVPVGWVFGLTPRDAWSALGSAGHFFEFALFAVLVAVSRSRRASGSSSGYLAGALAATGFGLAIEIVQIPIPYRSADPRDFAADVTGVAVALGALALARRRRASVSPVASSADPAVRGSEEVPS